MDLVLVRTVTEPGVSARGQARADRLMDAHLATLGLEHGATPMTTVRGFARFAGLRVPESDRRRIPGWYGRRLSPPPGRPENDSSGRI